MKTTILCMSVISAIIAFSSCKKEDQVTPIATLLASKTTAISIGEPISFSATGKTGTDSISWSVTPASSATISPSSNLAFISFKQQGKYTVTAKSNGFLASQVVTVTNNVYVSSTTTSNNGDESIVALTGDQIKITPSFDTTGNVKLYAVTTKSYKYLNNILISDSSFSGNTSTINYTGVYIPSQSNGIAGQQAAFTNNLIKDSVNGTYNLIINLNSVTYKGSYTKSGNTTTFTWPYTSGVTISPLTITK